MPDEQGKSVKSKTEGSTDSPAEGRAAEETKSSAKTSRASGKAEPSAKKHGEAEILNFKRTIGKLRRR